MKRIARMGELCLAVIALTQLTPGQNTTSTASDDWPNFGHDAGGMRFSPLAQINRENVL